MTGSVRTLDTLKVSKDESIEFGRLTIRHDMSPPEYRTAEIAGWNRGKRSD
jgi:hypothetical protein